MEYEEIGDPSRSIATPQDELPKIGQQIPYRDRWNGLRKQVCLHPILEREKVSLKGYGYIQCYLYNYNILFIAVHAGFT